MKETQLKISHVRFQGDPQRDSLRHVSDKVNTRFQVARAQAGFTLVEMLVAVAIFAIVMTLSVGTLIVLTNATGVSQRTQAVSSNLSFVIDSMSRNIRTGYFYYCADDVTGYTEGDTQDCTSGASGFAYTDGETALPAGYRLIDNQIQGFIGGSWLALTSDDVYIENLEFIVENTDPLSSGNEVQPFVKILIHGRFANEGESSPQFYIQTSVTSRTLDI